MKRLRALHRHWRRHPRVEWLVAGFVGYKPPADAIKQKQSDGAELMGLFGMSPGQTGTATLRAG